MGIFNEFNREIGLKWLSRSRFSILGQAPRRIDSWDKQLKKQRDKQDDLLGAAYFTSERDQYAIYSKPYCEAIDFLFIRDDLQAITLEDLDGQRVAVPKSFAQIETLKRYFPKIEIIEVESFDEAIDTVLERGAEILYDAYATLSYKLQREERFSYHLKR